MEFEQLSQIIASQLGIDQSSITRDSRFREDLKADSLDVAELIIELEETFGVTVNDEDIPKIVTVGDIAHYIENHK
ncbi:MAG: acyl carrier protein [Clostridia bacterium]|nr:acyl carrier protein [Clostridia bacterium]